MKANQFIAIGVSIVAIRVIIGGIVYVNKKTSRKKDQEILNTYYNCITGVTTRCQLYESTRSADGKFVAREVFFDCLKDYGINDTNELLFKGLWN